MAERGRRVEARSSGVTYAPKVVLELPLSDEQALEPFVEACLRDGVSLIAIVGHDASRIDDLIDELVVSNGSDPNRYITATMHPRVRTY